ncbi:uncharacterized protein LTR77_004431 [Saxophila tyrrhenica]|uniref:Uncharacterized protein n=1 Tax=Saxophila tyrrhenica TaxID=1690608 RepID=A0AAV9PCS1_9PEZI|nr:hypothetical protein LTR77_004431 [Saxophila tyrrhenica]
MAVQGDHSSINGSHGSLRHRKRHTVPKNAPFAGRIGGNQAFIATDDSQESEEILKKQPDAAPLSSLRDSLDPRGFFIVDTWRQAAIEAWGEVDPMDLEMPS